MHAFLPRVGNAKPLPCWIWKSYSESSRDNPETAAAGELINPYSINSLISFLFSHEAHIFRFPTAKQSSAPHLNPIKLSNLFLFPFSCSRCSFPRPTLPIDSLKQISSITLTLECDFLRFECDVLRGDWMNDRVRGEPMSESRRR